MDRRVLLFTTLGRPNQESERFITASFSSWKKYGFDVMVFGDSDILDITKKWGFNLNLNAEKNEFGLPLVRSLLQEGCSLGGHDVYMYVNSDIIFHTSPQEFINKIPYDEFMVVGQRYDVFNLPSINYLTDDYEDITNKLESLEGHLHNPGGIDYWGFTSNFWNLDDMPDFSIARGRFDHYLTGKAIEEGRGPVIDLSKVWLPYHPEPSVRTTGDFGRLFQEENYKLAYQIFRNTLYFGTEQKHGQTDMSQLYFDLEENVPILKNRTNPPKNEFGKILVNNDIRI